MFAGESFAKFKGIPLLETSLRQHFSSSKIRRIRRRQGGSCKFYLGAMKPHFSSLKDAKFEFNLWRQPGEPSLCRKKLSKIKLQTFEDLAARMIKDQ